MSYIQRKLYLMRKIRSIERERAIAKYWEKVSKRMKINYRLYCIIFGEEHFYLSFPNCTIIHRLEFIIGYKCVHSIFHHKFIKIPVLIINKVTKFWNLYRGDKEKIYHIADINGLEIYDESISLEKSIYYFKKKD